MSIDVFRLLIILSYVAFLVWTVRSFRRYLRAEEQLHPSLWVTLLIPPVNLVYTYTLLFLDMRRVFRRAPHE